MEVKDIIKETSEDNHPIPSSDASITKKETSKTYEKMIEGTTTKLKRYKPYLFVSLKKDRICMKPKISAYGSDINSLGKYIFEVLYNC